MAKGYKYLAYSQGRSLARLLLTHIKAYLTFFRFYTALYLVKLSRLPIQRTILFLTLSFRPSLMERDDQTVSLDWQLMSLTVYRRKRRYNNVNAAFVRLLKTLQTLYSFWMLQGCIAMLAHPIRKYLAMQQKSCWAPAYLICFQLKIYLRLLPRSPMH